MTARPESLPGSSGALSARRVSCSVFRGPQAVEHARPTWERRPPAGIFAQSVSNRRIDEVHRGCGQAGTAAVSERATYWERWRRWRPRRHPQIEIASRWFVSSPSWSRSSRPAGPWERWRPAGIFADTLRNPGCPAISPVSAVDEVSLRRDGVTAMISALPHLTPSHPETRLPIGGPAGGLRTSYIVGPFCRRAS